MFCSTNRRKNIVLKVSPGHTKTHFLVRFWSTRSWNYYCHTYGWILLITIIRMYNLGCAWKSDARLNLSAENGNATHNNMPRWDLVRREVSPDHVAVYGLRLSYTNSQRISPYVTFPNSSTNAWRISQLIIIWCTILCLSHLHSNEERPGIGRCS